MAYTKEECRHMEEEANYFAMCLLMPANMVKDEIKKYGNIDLGDDKFLKHMAKTFDVSTTAMALRLTHLRIFK